TLAAHGVQRVDVDRLTQPEDSHDDSQPDGHLGGGHGQHKEDKDLAVHRVELVREGHKAQVDGVEHHLDAHELDQRVATDQHAHRTDHKESCADDQERRLGKIIHTNSSL